MRDIRLRAMLPGRHRVWWAAAALVSALSGPAQAGDTVKQQGRIIFEKDGAGNIPPIHVIFPTEFGDAPAVTIAYPPGPHSPIPGHRRLARLTPTDITSAGFTANITPAIGPHIPADWAATGPELLHGLVKPNYLVLTVIYAPPGTSGHTASSVSYEAGSTVGISTSASDSFKNAASVSVEVSAGVANNGGSGGASFGYSHSRTNTQTLDIRKTSSTKLGQTGPNVDGLDHDRDAIWLLLKPTVKLAVSDKMTRWTLEDTPSPVQQVLVGQLNGHLSMSPGEADALRSAGITPDVYPEILARDPLAANQAAISSDRYTPLAYYSYVPSPDTSSNPGTQTYTMTASTAASSGSAFEDSYKVGVTVSGSASYATLVTAKMKAEMSWEWSNKSSSSNSTSTTDTAILAIGGPSPAYQGSTILRAYLDKVYNTFAFALVPPDQVPVALSGKLLAKNGRPVAGSPVTMNVGGEVSRAYTRTDGSFTFFGAAKGPARLQALGTSRAIPDVAAARDVVITAR